MGTFNDENILNPLLELLKDTNPKVREGAIASLSKLGGEQIIEFFFSVISEDTDDAIREMCIIGLSKFNTPKVTQVLEWLSKHAENVSNYESYPITRAAANALNRIQQPG